MRGVAKSSDKRTINPDMTHIESFNPNRDAGHPGDHYIVTTEAHQVILEVRKVGPETKGYHLAFVAAEPPITESDFYVGEIIVNDDEVIRGETFRLNAPFPILAETAFLALDIRAVIPTTVSK